MEVSHSTLSKKESPMQKTCDVVIVGAGIVGLATALRLAETSRSLTITVLEKEQGPARHQTGHNSGVIHSGIYYKPGSFKAKLCVDGAGRLVRFCEQHDIPYERCGKVVVAVRREEIPWLEELYRRGTANGVEGMRMLDLKGVKAYEPHVSCVQGLHVPTTGIVDFRQVARCYAQEFIGRGGEACFGHRLVSVERRNGRLEAVTTRGVFSTRLLINCTGLYADKVAALSGLRPPCRIVPFRGEYYQLKLQRRHLVRNLIYPVPDPRFPFLGVHFTRIIDGSVEAGPNAVLAGAREGYTKSILHPGELAETLAYAGFWRMAAKYWKPGFYEMARSFSKRLFVKALQQLVPEIRSGDVEPGGAGVRAQALGDDGKLLDDFVIQKAEGMVHVLNAPSPAATASLAIADHIVQAARPFL